MKISHSAMPRNRSSRSSRSPAAGSETAGTETAGAASRAIASAVPAGGGPAIRSAMDVIWHRFEVGFTRLHDAKDNIGPHVASKPGKGLGRRAVGRNYVE